MDTTDEQVTVTTALKNAARLLRNAELESDLVRMERVERLADSWVDIARLLMGQDSA
jgi:hypothetical protein